MYGTDKLLTNVLTVGNAERRNPMLLLRFVGVLLLRLAERRLFGLLFQLPPRITRLEALLHSLYPCTE